MRTAEEVTLYTVAEAAKRLNVTTNWLEERVSADAIPHRRLGRYIRFSAADLEQLAKQTAPAHVCLSGITWCTSCAQSLDQEDGICHETRVDIAEWIELHVVQWTETDGSPMSHVEYFMTQKYCDSLSAAGLREVGRELLEVVATFETAGKSA